MFLSKTKNIRIYDVRSYVNIINYKRITPLEIKHTPNKITNQNKYINKLLNIYSDIIQCNTESNIYRISNKVFLNSNAILCIESDDSYNYPIIDSKELCPGYLCIIDTHLQYINTKNLDSDNILLSINYIK